MIEVKVKTLDGRTHEFSVPDNAKVIEFKEIISEKMDISVDRQRLLYQGRVLQDDVQLSTYGVDGNVMHLVTRLPPQVRPVQETATDSDDNSDFNRDDIRHMLSDVLSNIGDINNPMGSSNISVNNDGNRMDITVNIPTQNRLSLSRLRQNYILRLLDQARSVVNSAVDPSITTPRDDRDRMRQSDPYDIGTNDERLTEVTSLPLPISNLADMIGMTRDLWRTAEPQLAQWESVLRRESDTDAVPRSNADMQRIHDSTSRYVHLFSHALHILSDYLVEFTPGTTRRTGRPRGTTTASGEVPTTESTAADTEATDRSRYLYVFSEMPAQLVQVRLDVDANIRDLRPSATPVPAAATPTAATPTAATPTATTTTTTESARPMHPPSEPATNPATQPNPTADPRIRSRRRFLPSNNTMENLFRSSFPNTRVLGSNLRPTLPTGTRALRSAMPHFTDNVDPYLRCQSRHFQHPSNLRSGAVISTFSGIRLRDNSRPRNPTGTPTSTSNDTTTPHTNVRTQSTDNHPMRSIISGLMNSLFASPTGAAPMTATAPSAPTTEQVGQESLINNVQSDIQGLLSTDGNALGSTLSHIFPEILTSHELHTDNFLINRIGQVITSRLTLDDLMEVLQGHYASLNQLRVPLQQVLLNHQQEVGSRDALVDHIVSDFQNLNEAYIATFERLRSDTPIDNLSQEAHNNFNIRLDICQTINNLNRHHLHSIIDMIIRSPTNHGFGQLLVSSLTSHHDQSLALIDIICNSNDELRHFVVKAFIDSFTAAIVNQAPPNQIGLHLLFGDLSTELFRRPDQLCELIDHTLTNFAVYHTDIVNGAASDDVNQSIDKEESIEDMVTNLSENVTNGATAIITEIERPNLDMIMDTDGHSAPWQSVLPQEWIQVMSRDSTAIDNTDDTNVAAAATAGMPYSDAYVAGMPAKRRKVIVSQRQRSIQPAADLMHECIDQAIRSAGINGVADQSGGHVITANGLSLNEAFQDLVTERVANRLTEEALNFVPERYPSTAHNFNRKKRPEDDKKNN